MKKSFFTADPHHGHKNVIKYGERPFLVEGETYEKYSHRSVLNMTDGLVDRWNSRVTKDDTVYILGDFAFHNVHDVASILDRLNGEKILVAGNHDSNQVRRLPQWSFVTDYHELYHEGKLLVLSHYPFAVWNKSHYGSYNLHGHSHGSFPGSRIQQDVGVDCWDFYPVTLSEIEKRMATFPEHKNRDRHRAK